MKFGEAAALVKPEAASRIAAEKLSSALASGAATLMTPTARAKMVAVLKASW